MTVFWFQFPRNYYVYNIANPTDALPLHSSLRESDAPTRVNITSIVVGDTHEYCIVCIDIKMVNGSYQYHLLDGRWVTMQHDRTAEHAHPYLVQVSLKSSQIINWDTTLVVDGLYWVIEYLRGNFTAESAVVRVLEPDIRAFANKQRSECA